MAKRVWLGHAPDVAQIDVFEFDEDECTILAERSHLEFVVNDKVLTVRAPDSVVDADSDAPGDTGAVSALLQAAEAAINSSTIPEFAELEAQLESPDTDPYSPYHRLVVTTREQFVGVPFTIEARAPIPTIDVDVVQNGGPGQNEIQRFRFTPAPTGGTYTVVWNLGSGPETSGVLPHDADAAAVQAALVSGMASLATGDVAVSGTGNAADPFVIELQGALAETNVATLFVSTTNLTGNGQVTIATLQNGRAGSSDLVEFLMWNSGSDQFRLHASTSLGFGVTGWLSLLTATAASVQAALEALPCVGTGNVTVAMHGSAFGFRFQNDLGGVNFEGLHPESPGMTSYMLRKLDGGAALQNAANFVANDATGGTFTITVDGQTTAPLAYNAGSGLAQTAVQGLSSVGAGNVEVIGYHFSSTNPRQAWGISFTGDLEGDDVTLTIDGTSLTGGTFALALELAEGGSTGGVNEIQSVSTNGVGGTFTLTRSSGGTTAGLSPTASAAQIETALEGLYGAGNIAVTGSGIGADPWLVEFNGALSGTDQPLMTGNGANLTGAIAAPVETVQDGAPPSPMIWDVTLHCATDGTFRLQFRGRKTAPIDYGASAAAVQAALEALHPGDFTGLWVVALVATDVYRITTAGRLLGAPLQLIAHNDGLIGMGQGITHTTIQAATGRNWVDNPVNWRDTETGETGLPDTGDEVFIQTGDDTNSLRYGSLAGRQLKRFLQGNMFRGHIGLPERTQTGYVEYRPTHLALEFEDSAQSPDNPNVVIGVEQGQGSGLLRLKTGDDEVHIRVERTGGPVEDGRPAFCWDGLNTSSTLQHIEGTVGVAVFAFASAQLAKAVQRGGALRFGEGTSIGSGGFDRVGGETLGRATIGGVPVIFGG